MTSEEVVTGILILFIVIAILAVAYNFSTPPPAIKEKTYPSVQQIKELNAQYASKRAKKEVEEARGKLLAFTRKPYYRSSFKKKSLDE